MFEIAGGILIAVCVLAFWPIVWRLGVLALCFCVIAGVILYAQDRHVTQPKDANEMHECKYIDGWCKGGVRVNGRGESLYNPETGEVYPDKPAGL